MGLIARSQSRVTTSLVCTFASVVEYVSRVCFVGHVVTVSSNGEPTSSQYDLIALQLLTNY